MYDLFKVFTIQYGCRYAVNSQKITIELFCLYLVQHFYSYITFSQSSILEVDRIIKCNFKVENCRKVPLMVEVLTNISVTRSAQCGISQMHMEHARYKSLNLTCT